ncbi:fluoride efflux transporter FluC [Lacticaseibacillus saniviri]
MRYRQFEVDYRVLLAVFVFGMLGGLARYGIGLALPSYFGTLTVNLIGSFFLTLILYWLGPVFALPTWALTGVGTGFVGAFTTFSTFSLETWTLLQQDFWWGVAYLSVSLIGGLTMAILGYLLAKRLTRGRFDD